MQWSKPTIRDTGPCRLWPGYKNNSGYGIIRVANDYWLAHQLIWQLVYGPIPEGLCVLHYCDNPLCCHPEHLWLGTRTDNNIDREEKGRAVILRGEEHGKARLTAEEVLAIIKDPRTSREIATDYGVTKTAISKIKSGQNWSSITGLEHPYKSKEPPTPTSTEDL